MPIYAFQCTTCGHHFDKLQKLSDPDPEVCPDCGAHTIKRQLTAPSFRLAGSGWYETDFKKGDDKKRNLVEKSDNTAPAETKTDSKTSDGKPADTKPDSKPTDTGKAAEKKADKPAAAPSKSDSKPAAKDA